MGCSGVPTAVFTETNLGTRLAVPASPDITAEDFKREVERMHLNCFPEFGTIRVKAVMVTQKLQRYHLSGSLPLKYAFLGSNVAWFIQTHVIFPTRVESSKHNEAEVGNLSSAANVITDSSEKRTKCKRKRVQVRRFPYLKASVLKISAASSFHRKRKRKNVKKRLKMRHPRRGRMQRSVVEKEMLRRFATGAEANLSRKSDTNVIAEATGETVSEPASVSGIIRKYFSDYDEVASNPESLFTTARCELRKQLNRSTGCEMMSPITVHMEMPGCEASREKHKTPDVGKRLLLASNCLGLTLPSSRRSILSLCRYNDGESPFHDFSATARNLAFAMADDGD